MLNLTNITAFAFLLKFIALGLNECNIYILEYCLRGQDNIPKSLISKNTSHQD